ncbi:MAG TPA: aminotransferase class V-fold PLP-dependent enzyme [Gemmatimonadales bacterium]|nr:aminotransferase class V-fold PLP-dependent enzyme [Gemmatimonadales bacterium]
MPGRHFLFVPGPTNVPDRILGALHVAMEDHRSSAFPALWRDLTPRLRRLFGTDQGRPLVFPGTGTGGWEAALTNVLSPGDRVLAPRFGQFSVLWADLARQLGFEVEVLDGEWGTAAPIDRIEAALRADRGHAIKALLIVHNETATGVTSDVAAVHRVLLAERHPALLLVDSVSGIGSLDFRMDEWGVDVAVTGSQKGLMLPAGLAIVCASPRAMDATTRATSRRSYFDFGALATANDQGYFPYTPSAPMLRGLLESLTILLDEEGMPAVIARHHRLAEGVRRAVKAMGLALCAREPGSYSDTVSTVLVPEGIDARKVISRAFDRYALSLGGGLGPLAGKAFRIGHLGDLNELMLLGALAGVEMALVDCGVKVTSGAGVAAAEEYWRAGD